MEYKLNTNWCLWYHSINDNKWSQSSYKQLLTITHLYGLKAINDIIQPIHLQNGMFFLMRENIFPTWEDPDNRDGCCVSFKIAGSVLKEQWDHIISEILTENIFINSENIDINYLNGISIAPKKEFNIIKIWLRNHDTNYNEILKEYDPYFMKDKALIKKHELSN